ncbi:GTP pyrophosphokinase [Planobispora rosea]|uniref:GTP pyrophosphokinase n=1 Tax=Planobispora rosea TaxID=35762 RepID=UPI000A06997D|nr:RelA/SpoT domain-containing protein [Planobispora rosea]
MSIEGALARYKEMMPRYKKAAEDVGDCLNKIASSEGVSCRISAREKDPKSFLRKAIVKKYDDPWSQITDKAGVRVIVESPSQVDKIAEAIKGENSGLAVLYTEDKRQIMDPEKLGYSGVHIQVAAPSMPEEVEQIECEIQLRTAAQDAWSIVSHNLLYKPLLELPPEHQRAIYRLVALIELFDQEVQRITDEIPRLPGYETHDLIQAAEAEYLPLVHATSDRQLSAFLLQCIQSSIKDEDRSRYPSILHEYVKKSRDELEYLYGDYGPKSAMASNPDYFMFGQAESLIILERLYSRPHLLVQAWRDGGLPPELLQAIIEASGLHPDVCPD